MSSDVRYETGSSLTQRAGTPDYLDCDLLREACSEYTEKQRNEDREQAAFTMEFLRQREASALAEVMKETSELMERCCLPLVEMSVLEKYILSIVRRGRPRPCSKESDKHHQYTTNAQCPCTSTSPHNHPELNRLSDERPMRREHNSGRSNSAGCLLLPRGARSRHAMWYAAFFPSNKQKHSKRPGPPHSLTMSEMNRSAFPTRPAARLLSHRGCREDRVATATFLYESAVADVLKLRRVLRAHEEATLQALVAIDRREIVMSRLRRFLIFAAQHLHVEGVDLESRQTCHIDPGDNIQHDSDHLDRLHHRYGASMTSRGSNDEEIYSLTGPQSSYTSDTGIGTTVKITCPLSRRETRRVRSFLPNDAHCQSRSTSQTSADPLKRFFRRGVLYLLHHLQWTSVVVVEAIAAWRRRLRGPYPFVIDGRNYMLVMAQQAAELSRDAVLRELFFTPTPSLKPQQPQQAQKGKQQQQQQQKYRRSRLLRCGFTAQLPCDKPAAEFPDSLQFYPLMTNMSQLEESLRPPLAPPTLAGDTAANVRLDEYIYEARQEAHCRHLGAGKRPLNVTFARRLYDAEARLQCELTAQLQLLHQQLESCAMGRYVPLLRGVAELNGAKDGAVRLDSQQLQRQWFCRLRETMEELAAGSSSLPCE